MCFRYWRTAAVSFFFFFFCFVMVAIAVHATYPSCLSCIYSFISSRIFNSKKQDIQNWKRKRFHEFGEITVIKFADQKNL